MKDEQPSEQDIRKKLDNISDEQWNVHEFECPKAVSLGRDACDCNMIRVLDDIEELIVAYGNQRELQGHIKESERHKDSWGKERTKELKQQKERD